MRFWLYKHAKRRYNLSHLTKVSAQTSGRGCKQGIQLGKTLYRFFNFINRKYFTLVLKIKLIKTILINCTGKFCYGYGHRQF